MDRARSGGLAGATSVDQGRTVSVKEAMRPMSYRVVQPWGSDKGRQSTLQSEHATIAEAFAALDAMAAQMRRTGAPSDAITLVVVDDDGRQVARPSSH